jgi:hypothetical protein
MNTLFRSLEAPASERKLSKGGPGGGSLFGGLEVAGQQPKAPKNKVCSHLPTKVLLFLEPRELGTMVSSISHCHDVSPDDNQ